MSQQQQKKPQKKRLSLEEQAKIHSKRYVMKIYDKEHPMTNEQKHQFLNVFAAAFHRDHPMLQYLQVPYKDIYEQYYEEIFTKHDEFFYMTLEDKEDNNRIVGGGMTQDCIHLDKKDVVKTDYLENVIKQELDYELMGYYYDFDKKEKVPGIDSYLIRVFIDPSVQKLKIAQVIVGLGFLDLIKRGYQKSMNVAYNKITQHLMSLYHPREIQELDLREKEYYGKQPFKDMKQNITVLDYDFTDIKTRETICKVFLKIQGHVYLDNYEQDYKQYVEQTLQEAAQMNYTTQKNTDAIRPSL